MARAYPRVAIRRPHTERKLGCAVLLSLESLSPRAVGEYTAERGRGAPAVYGVGRCAGVSG